MRVGCEEDGCAFVEVEVCGAKIVTRAWEERDALIAMVTVLAEQANRAGKQLESIRDVLDLRLAPIVEAEENIEPYEPPPLRPSVVSEQERRAYEERRAIESGKWRRDPTDEWL